MGFTKQDNLKEYVCRQCSLFLDNEELYQGNCPECGNDDSIYMNDIFDEEE